MNPQSNGHCRRQDSYGAGFTLIELMITVAIVAILTAIAYPSYRNYVLRGQLVYATNGLSALSANMERYYQDNRTYAVVNGLNPPCPTSQATAAVYGTFLVWCPTIIDGTALVPSSYQAQAVGAVGGPTDGFTFTVNQIPIQSTSIVAPAPSGWIINCANTWVSKAGSC